MPVCDCILTAYNSFLKQCVLGVLRNGEIKEVCSVKTKFTAEEHTAMVSILSEYQDQQHPEKYKVPPGICVTVRFDKIYNDRLEGAVFQGLSLKRNWRECTWIKVVMADNLVDITNPEKELWPDPSISKEAYLEYVYIAAPYMLPFLKNRLLTAKRYPDGVNSEGFYQKSTPSYAPDFVKRYMYHGNDYTVCDNIQTLLWLANQSVVEFHIPFEQAGKGVPSEIVFDLDPPHAELQIAVKAALEMKVIFDQFELVSFVKLSGRKGIQIHLPLNGSDITYERTRVFTSFIAQYLTEKHPDLCTTERLKKKRKNRLYIDYIQHDRDKTIICPYSPRETIFPGIAVPLFWDELRVDLKVKTYSILEVKKRVLQKINPLADYFSIKQSEKLKSIIAFIDNHPAKPLSR